LFRINYKLTFEADHKVLDVFMLDDNVFLMINCRNAIICLSYKVGNRVTKNTMINYFAYQIEPCLKSASFFADRLI
jgi:hypothetical protein